MITGTDVLVPVERGQWGRPIVDGKPRVRCSKFAKALDTAGGLPAWYSRQTAKGLILSDDLMARAATADPDDDQVWREIGERAMERSASFSGADIGSAIHSVSEAVDRGDDISRMPSKLRAAGEAYRDATGDFEPLAAEMFIYCERYDTAGSFDRLVRMPDGTVAISDTKTSKDVSSAWRYSQLAWSLQLIQYALGKPYCAKRGLLDWSDLDLPEPCDWVGLIVAIERDTAETRLHEIDLRAGRHAADLALRVEKARKYQFATTGS